MPPVTPWVSSGAPQTTRRVHPSGVQSWAGGSRRSPDPQTPQAALVQGSPAPLLGPGALGTPDLPAPANRRTAARWRRTKVCHCALTLCPGYPHRPPPRRHALNRHRHGGISLPPALGGVWGLSDNRRSGSSRAGEVRTHRTWDPPLAQAEIQPNPTRLPSGLNHQEA